MNAEPGTVKALEIGGVPILVHWSVAAGVGLLALIMKFDPTATISLAASYLCLITIHEAAHAIAARSFGLKVFSIRISGIGGLCRFQYPTSYRAAFLISSAGVLAQTVVLAGTLVSLAVFGKPSTAVGAYVATSFVYLNAVMILVNLVPEKPRASAFGTDGYLLWKLALNRLRNRPYGWPDTSATFSPDTRLAHVRGFAPPGFDTGIEILNDNTTPMDYVVSTLTTHLQISRDEAVRLMLDIHTKRGVVIAFPTHEEALSVANAMSADARANGHQLVCRAVSGQRGVPP